MLWVDKYRPKVLEQLNCHNDLSDILKRIVAQPDDIPHLVFYGPSGGGKKTRIMALLRHMFGEGVDKVKAETISPEGTNTEFCVCSSLYHNQISASELGKRDRVCVQMMIRQLASQVGASAFSFCQRQIPRFRIFIIQEAEFLSVEAQAGLRRTLERYINNARVILHCQQLSTIIPPLRSRCLCLRVPNPTNTELLDVLQDIVVKEQISVTDHYLRNIVKASKRNMRRAILMLETAVVLRCPLIDTISKVPWETYCQEIVNKVLQDQSPKSLMDCREKMYDILSSCIPGDLLLQTLSTLILEAVTSPKLKLDIARAAAHYSFTLRLGSKDIWHCEAFLAQTMSLLKSFACQNQRI